MKEFDELLYHLVREKPRKSERKKSLDARDEVVIRGLERALDDGRITRANLKLITLTGHENTQQMLNAAFWKLGPDQSIQDKLRTEVHESNITDPMEESFTKLPYLTSVVAELLRCYPSIRQGMNRILQKASRLGNVGELPQGTFVGWNAYGVQTDTQVWGPTARDFIPKRWLFLRHAERKLPKAPSSHSTATVENAPAKTLPFSR